MTVRVQKWGNSLGVRIPKAVAHQSAIHVGSELEVVYDDDQVILRPVKVPSLRQLLAKAKPKNRPDVVEWGKPVGREAW